MALMLGEDGKLYDTTKAPAKTARRGGTDAGDGTDAELAKRRGTNSTA